VKSIAAVGLLLILGASVACAEDIKGKWGLGAGVFGGGGEVSLIRGKSDRSAWLFDVSMANVSSTEESDPGSSLPLGRNDDNVAMRVGPGYRGYVRMTEGLSPYWDLAAHFLYNRSHSHANTDGFTNKSAGGDAVFSFGLEYFTPWHFSIAADSEIGGFSWTRDTRSETGSGVTTSSTGHTQRASLRLSPVLYVRGYF
jgi:hypothetical protein